MNADQKVTAYVAELKAARGAIYNLRQIEEHLQNQLRTQEEELVKLRLNSFKMENDRNMNLHLKARIASQAEEFEHLRKRVAKAENLVMLKDSQLEDAKNVVRTLRDRWNVLQEQQAEVQKAVLEMAEQKIVGDAKEEEEEEDKGGSTKKEQKETGRSIDIEPTSPRSLEKYYNLSPNSIKRLKEYSSSLRERCQSQENVIGDQAKEINELKGTIYEFKERCRRQRAAIKTLKLRAGGSHVTLSSSSPGTSLLEQARNFNPNMNNNNNTKKKKKKINNYNNNNNINNNNNGRMPPWNFRAGNSKNKKKTNQRYNNHNNNNNNSITNKKNGMSRESKEILIENLRERIERDAAAALMNTQRQLKNEYERKLMEARNLAQQREAKVENELDKLKSTIIKLLTVVGDPDKINMGKILNGVEEVIDNEVIDMKKTNEKDEEKVEDVVSNNNDNNKNNDKKGKEEIPPRAPTAAALPTIVEMKNNNSNNNISKTKTNSSNKVKSALWSSSDSEDDGNYYIDDSDAYTSAESSIDF